jgi:hypothetical protein
VADYPELAAVVYVGDPRNPTAPFYYRCTVSDGTGRATDGEYIRLADARGMFLRGYDITGENDPEGATRYFPGGVDESENQGFALQSHTHPIETDLGKESTGIGCTAPAGGATRIFMEYEGGSADNTLSTQPIEDAEVSDDETRPVNIQVKICIRY